MKLDLEFSSGQRIKRVILRIGPLDFWRWAGNSYYAVHFTNTDYLFFYLNGENVPSLINKPETWRLLNMAVILHPNVKRYFAAENDQRRAELKSILQKQLDYFQNED